MLVIVTVMAGCSSNKEPEQGTDSETVVGIGEIKVSLSIMCGTLESVDKDLMDKVSTDGEILKKTEFMITPGMTVLDVLKASGVDFVENGGMVSEINGLGSGQAGEMSGWLFTINDEFPMDAVDQLTLNEGDEILFAYTCDGGEDLGMTF